MGMLRMAMRPTNEFGGVAGWQRAGAFAPWNVGLACGLALLLAVRTVRAEGLDHKTPGQSESLSNGGSHLASPRGIPPHAHGYLGILFQDLSDKQLSSLHLAGGRGVEVMMVDHDGPAGKAGLRTHDVIVSLNGQMISSADGLRRMIHDAGVGTAVTLAVIRGGKQVTVNAQLAYRGEVEREALARMAEPDRLTDEGDPVVGGAVAGYEVPQAAVGGSSKGHGFLLQMIHNTPFTGIALEAMEPQLAEYFGSSTGGGLLVETVVANSPGAGAGIRAGDVVLRVDSIVVRSTADWVKRLHEGKGRGLVLTVLRDKHEQTITLIPEAKRHSEVEWPEIRCSQPLAA